MRWRRTAAPLILMVALAACTMVDGDPDAGDEGAPRVTAENLDPPIALPDFDRPEDLERALTRFGECVEERFPIVLRYRTDPFLGMSTEISSQRRDEGELVEQVSDRCMTRFDLDRRLSRYQQDRPPTESDRRRLVDDFAACAHAISPEVARLLAATDPSTIESITMFVANLPPPPELTGDELVGVTECHDGVTGREQVFADGHPWVDPG